MADGVRVVVRLRDMSHSLVLDVGDVAVFVGVVGDNLDAAVGQGHTVLAGSLVAVPRLGVGKVVTSVVVFDGVPESVVLRRLVLRKWNQKRNRSKF